MPFKANLFNPCILPVESSSLSSTPSQSSSSSLKSIIRRYLFKKHSNVIRDHRSSSSTRQFHRIRGSNLVREVNFKCKFQTNNNYDMTILHDDELENTQLATIRRRKKKIPSWANKEQLQLAIINQVYFDEMTPEDIFGSICMENVFDIINSINVKTNGRTTSKVVSRYLI